MKDRIKKPRERLELEIESIAFPGNGVAKIDGFVWFVKGAVTGDLVVAEVSKKRSKYGEAKAVEVIRPSSMRVEPGCEYFGVCGGCTWRQLDYRYQIEQKRLHVKESIERIGKIEGAEILDAMPSPMIANYRNKMEFSFGASRWLTESEIASEADVESKNFALGLHIPGRYDKILEIKECKIQSEIGNDILKMVGAMAREAGVGAYDTRTHKGFLRNLIIRTSRAYDSVMCVLLTSTPESREEKRLIERYMAEIPAAFPRCESVIHAVNDTSSPVARGEFAAVAGKTFIREKILDVDYKISPFSFFQTNSFRLDGFIGKIIEFAKIGPDDVVWDLYCGAGSITLPASKKCKEIIGIEIFEDSIIDAKANARDNGIENARLICADLHAKNAPELILSLPKPDVAIIDPPRAGMHKNLVDTLLEIEPKAIVYVSCNPTTQARDCEILSAKYDVKTVLPVDMFPHTFHIESIARLELKQKTEAESA